MSPKHGKNEKTRSHERFKPNRKIRFFLLDGSEITGIIEVNDISESGLQFTGKEFVKKGADINVSVDAGKKGQDPVVLHTRVAWVTATTYVKGTYRVGLSFLDLKDEQKSFIREMKKRKWLFG